MPWTVTVEQAQLEQFLPHIFCHMKLNDQDETKLQGATSDQLNCEGLNPLMHAYM